MTDEQKEKIAMDRYLSGEKPQWSSGIHGGYTCGYGELDSLGYFEFPLYDLAKKQDEEFEKIHKRPSFSDPQPEEDKNNTFIIHHYEDEGWED